MTDQEIQDALRQFILRSFLKGRDPAMLTPATPLISSGLLDSLAVTEVLMFVEDKLHVQFDPTEADPPRFDTLELMARAIRQKMDESGEV